MQFPAVPQMVPALVKIDLQEHRLHQLACVKVSKLSPSAGSVTLFTREPWTSVRDNGWRVADPLEPGCPKALAGA